MSPGPIIVVDDDDQFRSMLRELLSRAGYEVTEARSAREAMDACDRVPTALMITDILMPDANTLETIATLRTAHPDLRIIATSGGGQEAEVPVLALARRSGAHATLAKPFSRSKLLETVRALLDGE